MPIDPKQPQMATPQAIRQMLKLGLVSLEGHPHCSHREGAGPSNVKQCANPAIVICGACGVGTCSEAWHVFSRFITVRGGSPFDAEGSRFFYRCEPCSDFLCIRCLGIADDYPCDPAELERYVFKCPNCNGNVRICRVDGVDMAGAAENLMLLPSRMLKMGG